MAIDESKLPLFLGMSHRAARRGAGWDFLGVTTLLMFTYFPQRLTGLQCLMAMNRRVLTEGEGYSYKVLMTDMSNPTNQGWSEQKVAVKRQDSEVAQLPKRRFSIQPTTPETGPTFFHIGLVDSPDHQNAIEIVPIPAPPLTVWHPCSVSVEVEVNGIKYPSGGITCGFVSPPPLSDEERRAIASRPGASKSIAFRLGCISCGDEATFYSLLNPLDQRPKELPPNAIVLNEAPTDWLCSCRKTPIELTYLKQGLHDLFRYHQTSSSENLITQYTPLYEAGRIQTLIAEYEQLIETAGDEETIQKYLEENPIFWAFLAPIKILHKPAVLTKKKADFGILTSQKVLFLVEIEKPTTRLTNQDGAVSADIQRGANQIRDWEAVVTDHRLALLSELGLKEGEVQEIRYLLIGGLARRSNATGLTKIRRSPPFGLKTDFYCFDELSSFLHTLAAELPRL